MPLAERQQVEPQARRPEPGPGDLDEKRPTGPGGGRVHGARPSGWKRRGCSRRYKISGSAACWRRRLLRHGSVVGTMGADEGRFFAHGARRSPRSGSAFPHRWRSGRVAHGYVRYTVDLDLVVALDAENVRRATGTLARLGYKPLMPVNVDDLADPLVREQWAREKGMVVFQLVSDQHPETPVDIFVTAPFDFEAQYTAASWLRLPGGLGSASALAGSAPNDEKGGRSTQGPVGC